MHMYSTLVDDVADGFAVQRLIQRHVDHAVHVASQCRDHVLQDRPKYLLCVRLLRQNGVLLVLTCAYV